MSEINRGELPEEANRLAAFWLKMTQGMGERSRGRMERRADREREKQERRAARALATGGTKKGGTWERFGTPTLGGASAGLLLGAFHGNEWLKKWVWGKNRAQWNSALAGIKGFMNIQVV